MRSFIMLIISIIILLATFPAYAKEKITWLVNDWPPYMMTEGEDKDKGMIDLLVRMYIENLPEYLHAKRKMNWKRF